MIVPFEMIDKTAVRHLVEEFVSRDGTDNGYDQSLEHRIEQVLEMLVSGEMLVVFDPTSETTNIITKELAVSLNY